MARAALGWSIDDLARQSGVNRRTIINFENDGPASSASTSKLRAALEAEGVVLIERGNYSGGVVPPSGGR